MIKTSERVTIVGKTGSGKSYLARSLLAGVKRLVVADPKGTLTTRKHPEWRLEDWSTAYPKLKQGRNARARIPPPGPDDNEGEYWETHLKAVYNLGGLLVYIDELYGVGPPGGSGALRALYTRGRELEIGVWSATQRPALIPLVALSEADWLFLFQLRMAEDKDRMIKLIGPDAGRKLTDHQFLVFHDTLDKPRFYEKLTVRRR